METSRALLPPAVEQLKGELSHSDENSLIGLLRYAHAGESLRTSREVREEIEHYTNAEGTPPRAALFVTRLALGGYMSEVETVGYAATTFDPDTRRVDIEHLFVHPAARGRKLGSALVHSAIAFAHVHKAEQVTYGAQYPHSQAELDMLRGLNFVPNLEQTPVIYLATKH